MPLLFNDSENNSLLSIIYEQTQKIASEEIGDWTFYVITCYFNPEAAKELIRKISEILDNKLKGIHILVDSVEFIKLNIDKDNLINNIRNEITLDDSVCSLTPISYGSKLFHPKSYALINTKNTNGFALITSANFTERGLKKNIEIGTFLNDENSIDEFAKIFNHVKKKFSLSEYAVDEQRQFQTATQTLSQGNFYHAWNPSFDLKFRLKLSKKVSKKIYEISNNEIQDKIKGFKLNQINSIIEDVINIDSVLNTCPKPIPDFWGIYSIDTLLGRWVPLEISQLIDEEIAEITKILEPIIKEKGNTDEIELCEKYLEYFILEIYKEDETLLESLGKSLNNIKSWSNKVRNFFSNDNLLNSFICKYEKIPISVNNLEYDLIMSIYKRINDFYSCSDKHRGLGKTFAEIKENDDIAINNSTNLVKDINRLVDELKDKLERNRLCELFEIFSDKKNTIKQGDKFIAFIKPFNNETEYKRLDGTFVEMKKSNKGIYQSKLVYKTKNENQNQEILIGKLKVFKKQAKKDTEEVFFFYCRCQLLRMMS